MKIRKGFVTNSSSSSFIVLTEADENICKRFNIKMYKVKDLLKKFQPLIELQEQANKWQDTDECPYFMLDGIGTNGYIEDLIELHKKHPEASITAPFDRDIAAQSYIYMDVFEGDL